MGMLLRVFRWFGLLLITGSALLLFTILYLKSKPLPPPEISMTTKIVDENGRVIDQLDDGEHRDPIRLSHIPRSLVAATLAAEDQSFYRHWGFSLKGIARAAWINLKEHRLAQGASTITQQLARNLYLTQDRTWSRKLKEAALTAQLELHYSKNEILEMYLNKIYYGHGAYGIQRAAKIYFDKPVEQLTLAESAMLAGIPRGPAFYSPFEHPERAKRRQRAILDTMAKRGFVQRAEAEEAKREPIVLAGKPPSENAASAPYFRDYIVKTAITQLGLDEELVHHGGLTITTTLNLKMQKAAEQAVKQYVGNKKGLQAALISIEPKTGYIRAMVGGKSYRESQYNRVFAKRQPGSSFKPILYLAALQNGYTPLTRIESRPTAFTYQGKTYAPQNFGGSYANRPITLREAIARSDNIYAVTTHFRIGLDHLVQTARRLGVRSPLRAVPSLALGTYAVSPFEMGQVYATLANGGVRNPPTGILKIVDANGQVLYQHQPRPSQTVPAAPTFVLTHLLESVFDSGGTAHRVKQMLSRPMAGKTGSTNWDGWLSGYTPELATTVWVGYDRQRTLPHRDARLSQYIWGAYMHDALKKRPPVLFHPPNGVKGVYVDPDTDALATDTCPHPVLEYFVAGTEPKEPCPVHPSTSTDGQESPSIWDRIIQWFQ
jgi:1A family penicillin-binding protein